MGARLLHFIFLALLTVILTVPNAFANPTPTPKERKNILYLNSYHNGYAWSDNLLEGFKERIQDSPYSIMLQVEYLDSKKFPYNQAVKHVMDLFRRKFADTTFDLITVSDNDAFNFITQHGEDIFPGVPIVFVGVNDFNPSLIKGKEITGVMETFDVASNIRLALEMHPNLKQMIVIGDESVTGKAIRKQVIEGIPNIDKGLKVQFWTDMPHREIIRRVKQLRLTHSSTLFRCTEKSTASFTLHRNCCKRCTITLRHRSIQTGDSCSVPAFSAASLFPASPMVKWLPSSVCKFLTVLRRVRLTSSQKALPHGLLTTMNSNAFT
ncbi:ABC transporter substrate-binding protein [Halodesulfovibrio sp. MK-HDV]|uniref:ABC transporter substrate-binding protein n=1 Tax=Halodesulfovibrio sp. MK-HDV TaxID=2599925 RepID=UPI0020B13E28|nr:hypothetical protein [Halodesulfovibrio sp. MK-HDV]